MEKNVEPFTKESVLSKMISKRIKSAKRCHDRYILSNYTVNKNIKTKEIQEEICNYMPPRKRWVSLGESKRRKKTISLNRPNQTVFTSIDSVRKNKKRLELTIMQDSKLSPPPKYYSNLINFIDDILNDFNQNQISISSPKIIPKKKDEEGKKLRPLCIFALRDNLILQETNSFLIKHYDEYFSDCSYAFRGKREINGTKKIPTHHDTIDKILEYKKRHSQERIYVTEYDLKKFFDTIDHRIIKRKVRKLLHYNTKSHISHFWKIRIRHIFSEYLSCYTFYKCVFSKNEDKKYLRKHGFPNGHFEWVEEDLKHLYGKRYTKKKIGIPQGGALSGFIANLVLDEVDKKLMELNDPDLLYLRYCDDMIMLHTDKTKLEKAANLYKSIIKHNKLFIHEPVTINHYDASFYDSKSRNIYEWGAPQNNMVPWISFVGYQIGYKGEIRIRKQSVEKEINKQEKIVNETIHQISHYPIKSPLRVIRSVIQRLQGMSVGHINLYSFDNNPSLCWITGFCKLTNNYFSRKQMKRLDANRCKQIKRLCKEVRKYVNQVPKSNSVEDNSKNEPEIIYSGKPFSYFGWLEKK